MAIDNPVGWAADAHPVDTGHPTSSLVLSIAPRPAHRVRLLLLLSSSRIFEDEAERMAPTREASETQSTQGTASEAWLLRAGVALSGQQKGS